MRVLARPREDKVVIFDANAQTIIITGVLCVCVCVCSKSECGSLFFRCVEGNKSSLPLRNYARTESQDQGKRCHAAAYCEIRDYALLCVRKVGRNRNRTRLFRTRAWLRFFGKDCPLRCYSETRTPRRNLNRKFMSREQYEAFSRGVHSVV